MRCNVLVYVCVLADDSSSDSRRDDDAVKGDRLSSPGRPHDDEEEEEIPVYLWRPGQTTDVIGEWEQHTSVSGVFTLALITRSGA